MNPLTSHTAGEAFAVRKVFLRWFSVGKDRYHGCERQQEHELGLEETRLKLYIPIREETDNSKHDENDNNNHNSKNNNNHRFEAKAKLVFS